MQKYVWLYYLDIIKMVLLGKCPGWNNAQISWTMQNLFECYYAEITWMVWCRNVLDSSTMWKLLEWYDAEMSWIVVLCGNHLNGMMQKCLGY